jgi:Tol biopolymer transport system component
LTAPILRPDTESVAWSLRASEMTAGAADEGHGRMVSSTADTPASAESGTREGRPSPERWNRGGARTVTSGMMFTSVVCRVVKPRRISTHMVTLSVCLAVTLPAAAAVPGENGALAVVREGDHRGIWTIDRFSLTRLIDGEDYRPRWSPDGSRIVFQRFEGNRSNIFVMDADGSDVRQLTSKGGFPPAWSPDGSRIVFGSGRDGDEDVFVMAADGSGETKLTRNTFSDVTAAWSPDGAWIAFASRRNGNTDLYLIRPDGSDEVRFTRNDAHDRDPDWAPDGTQVVFQSNRNGWDIYTKHMHGGTPARLTRGPALDWAPAWAPDGTKIAYTLLRARRDVQDVVILDLTSGDRLRLVIPGSSELEPNWQPV